jgi:hypothetical protein
VPDASAVAVAELSVTPEMLKVTGAPADRFDMLTANPWPNVNVVGTMVTSGMGFVGLDVPKTVVLTVNDLEARQELVSPTAVTA